MAILSNLRPGPPSLLVDSQGREMQAFPADVARALLFIDERLAALGLRFNVECHECSLMHQRPSYGIPRVVDGVFTLNCDHANRRVRLETA